MSKKYTIDTIKDLKVKVKELDETLLNYYTQSEFKPDNSFHLFIEQSGISQTDAQIVTQMISAFENNETEFEAGKILFEHLNQLSPKQASDIGFWTYHNHHTFYPYITKRWSDLWNLDKSKSYPSTYIINHWIQSNSSQQELMKYPISGLWWSFYLTVDEEREDKYELTKIFFKNYSLRVVQLGQTRFARHKPAILGVLEFIKENKLEDKSLEQSARSIVPYINLLGGIRPLTYFDKEWFKNKLQTRFGEQITKGEKLFIRPDENQTVKQDDTISSLPNNERQSKTYNRYFCLNPETGNYQVTSQPENTWHYCIGLDFNVKDQFLIHFYKEGKIKKSKVNGNLSNKTVDRPKPYSNGKCPKLTLSDLQLINQPVLFGIAYKTRYGTFFKAMDEQDMDNFRTDNPDLNQEGKKVLYIDETFQSAYKILPYDIKNDLGTLVQKSPVAKGADVTNDYYSERWSILRKYWPELFNGSVKWK